MPTNALVQATEEPVDEFFQNPDFRQISCFFLGWTFIISVHFLVLSPSTSSLFRRLNRFFRRRISTDCENPPHRPSFSSDEMDEKAFSNSETSSVIQRLTNHSLLIFTLDLCFALSSVAQFASLLAFAPGGYVCAFVIAWGGMAAQLARLVALVIILLDLKAQGIKKWEYWLSWAFLIIGLGFVFANNAIGVGSLQPVDRLNVSFCYRKHFLPTSLAASITYTVLEIYVLARLVSFLAPPFLQFRHRLALLKDFRSARPLSLLILELLTVVPGAVKTNVLAEHIPFSIGALVVLYTFNRNQSLSSLRELSIHSIPSSSQHTASHNSAITVSNYTHIQTIPRSSVVSFQPPYQPRIPNHPFSSASLDGTAILDNITARSSKSVDSHSAHSVRDAVVQIALRRTQRLSKMPNLSLSKQSRTTPSISTTSRGSVSSTNAAEEGQEGVGNQVSMRQFRFPAESSRAPENDTSNEAIGSPDSVARHMRVISTLISFPSSATSSRLDIDSRRESQRSVAPSIIYGSDIIRRSSDSAHTRDMMRANDAVEMLHVPNQSRFSMSDLPSASYPSVTVRRVSYMSTAASQAEDVAPIPTIQIPERRPPTSVPSSVANEGSSEQSIMNTSPVAEVAAGVSHVIGQQSLPSNVVTAPRFMLNARGKRRPPSLVFAHSNLSVTANASLDFGSDSSA